MPGTEYYAHTFNMEASESGDIVSTNRQADRFTGLVLLSDNPHHRTHSTSARVQTEGGCLRHPVLSRKHVCESIDDSSAAVNS